MRLLLLVALLTASVNAAEHRTVQVSVSSYVTAPADQVVFGVAVRGPASLTLDRAVTAVQSLGLGASNLTGISTVTYPSKAQATVQLLLQYDFALTIPLSQLNSTTSSLQTLMTNLTKQSPDLTLGFQLGQFTSSPTSIDQLRQRALSDLLSQARQRATLMATAAGGLLGQVKSVTDSTYLPSNTAYQRVTAFPNPNATTSTGTGTTTSTGTTSLSYIDASTQQVQFSLQVVYDLE